MQTALSDRRWPVAFLLLVGAALAPAAAWAKGPPPKVTPAVAEESAPSEPSGITALLAAADDITRQVAALRGLEPRRPIARGVLSRNQIGAKLKERIGKEYTPEEIRIESRVLKRLGLLPPEVDYKQLLIDLLMEQVAGFYDPFARQLYIADWLGLELQRPAMAHELQHALQDQHFDLKAFATPMKEDGDRQLARTALVEGDGTAVMLEFVAQSLGLDLSKVPNLTDSLGQQLAAGAMNQSPVFNRAPRFLRETLLFPYFAGMKFVYVLRSEAKKGSSSWSRVNDAFKNPPDSTEQVMHPEKFINREKPMIVTAAPVPALAPQKELRRDVLGELEFRVLFASRLADGTADKAAEGWGGDRLVAYGETSEEDKPVCLIDLSAWDSEEDAKQATSALRALVARQIGRSEPSPSVEPAVFEKDAEAWHVERRGSEVLAMFGVPAATRTEIAEQVWSGWKVAQPKGAQSAGHGKRVAKTLSPDGVEANEAR